MHDLDLGSRHATKACPKACSWPVFVRPALFYRAARCLLGLSKPHGFATAKVKIPISPFSIRPVHRSSRAQWTRHLTHPCPVLSRLLANRHATQQYVAQGNPVMGTPTKVRAARLMAQLISETTTRATPQNSPSGCEPPRSPIRAA